MSEYTYTKNILTGDGSRSAIQPNDIVMLNASNIWMNVDDNVSGLNPIPSFDIAKGISSTVDLSVREAYRQISVAHQNALSALSEISSASVDYSLASNGILSVVTSLKQNNGKTTIEARQLVSTDVAGLSSFVDGKIGNLKQYVIDGYLSLSGGVVVGNLSIDRDHALSISDSSSFAVGNQSLCALLSNELLLSTSTAVEKLSTDLSNDFGFGYDIKSNTISAHVAGRTHWFSANRFTEARMLESARIETLDGKPWLILEFKVDSPDAAYNKVSVDLAQIAPMYYGANGIDVQYDGDRGKYCISADSTVCHLSDIEILDVGNSIVPGQILSSLKQENGFVTYGTAPILSSYVKGLPEYVDYALSNYNAPLSTVYGDWHIYQSDPTDPAIDELRLSTTTEAGIDKTWYAPFSNGQQLADFQELLDPYYIKFPENGRIHETVAMRKADHYILGNHINQPIQPKIQFGMLSALDAYPLDSSLNFDSPLSTVISAVVAIRDTIKQLRDSIEHLSA